MKKLIEKINALHADYKAKANEHLKRLEPLQQQEAASEFNVLFRHMRNAADEFAALLDHAGSKLGDTMQAEMADALQSPEALAIAFPLIVKDPTLAGQFKQQMLAEGAVVTKETAEELATKAADTARKALVDEQQAEAAEMQVLETRRGELAAAIEGKLKGSDAKARAQELASKFDAAGLKDSAGYKLVIEKVSGRIGKLVEANLAKPNTMQEVASLAADDAGDAIFTRQLGVWQEIAAPAKSRIPFAAPTAPQGKAGDGKKRPVVV